LFTWGLGSKGQLGHGNCENQNTPQLVKSLENVFLKSVKLGWQHSICLSVTGAVYAWGCNEDGQLGHGDY